MSCEPSPSDYLAGYVFVGVTRAHEHLTDILAMKPGIKPREALTHARNAIDAAMANLDRFESAKKAERCGWPEGRSIFYEGHDPEGFRAEIKAKFGFDVADKPRLTIGHEGPVAANTWNEEYSFSFHCPAEHLDAIYTGYPLGS